MSDQIKANTCPYCDSPYTIAAGGCESQCQDSEKVKSMIAEAIEGDPGEAAE